MLCCAGPRESGFSFSSWQAYCASNAGERVDMKLISHALGKFLTEKTLWDVPRQKKLFISFYSSSITGVYLRDLHESRMSHELFSASWNAYCTADLTSVRVGSCYLCCFFHLLLRCVNGNPCDKRWDCSKTSCVKVDEGSLADCVVFNDVWAGPCRLATQRCLI